MNSSPEQDVVTEFRMTPKLSVVYAQILHTLESVCGISFAVEDLMGSCEVKLVENSSSKMVYRGYICLDGLRKSSFQRVEFCAIYRWDIYDREFKNLSLPPTEAMIMIGWSSTLDTSLNRKAKSFGCRLFRTYCGSMLDDVALQPKNWATPYLWGNLPSFLDTDEVFAYMLKNELDTYVSTDNRVLILAAME